MTLAATTVRTLHAPCPLCRTDDSRQILRVDELSLRQRSRLSWPIVRCRRCRLVRVDPQPAQETTRHVYQGDAYGFVRSPQADAFVDGTPHAQRILRELDRLSAGGTLLDVGSATGDFLVAARERGWQTCGVELSAHAAALAKGRGLEIRVGTLQDAQLASASFEAVTMLDVIEHLADPLTELREVHRVLRPGGILVVETPNWGSIYRHLLGRRWAALQPRLHLLYLDRGTATDLLTRAGFEPIQVRTEIVALFSPEGSARGIGPSLARGLLRDATVRLLLRLKPGPWDGFFLRIGPAARIDAAAGSFKKLASASDGWDAAPHEWVPPRGLAAFRALNRPLDLLLLRMGMGEQLRIHARKV